MIKYEEGNCVIDSSIDEFLEKNCPQSLEPFKSQMDSSFLSRFIDLQGRFDHKYNRRFFAPWNSEAVNEFSPKVPSEYCGFGENLHPLGKKELEQIQKNVKNCHFLNRNAIVVKNTMAKRFPSDKPCFEDIRKPGDSYPFDSNIQSAMKIGTPVKAICSSYDKSWIYANSHLFSGWIPAEDVAFVDSKFEKRFTSSKLCVAIKDNIVIQNKDAFVTIANLGTIFPVSLQNIMVPYRDGKGDAQILFCKKPEGFVAKPYPFSADNIIQVAQETLGTKYGWGGFLNNRDCSMLTSDFFAVFGKHVEKSSLAQIRKGIDVTKLSSTEKAEFIMQNGIPFFTLVGWKGHVMLYIGVYNNQPIFLHNAWGLSSRYDKNSRYVIGKTIISPARFCNNFDLLEKITYVFQENLALPAPTS